MKGLEVFDVPNDFSILGTDDANNTYSSSSVVANRDGSIIERTEFIIDALQGTQFRTERSAAGPVEEGAYQQFSISLFDLDSGAIASASINITAITNVMSKSTGGAAFSSVGITQPTFAKANGLVSCSYLFVAGEWEVGDLYRLVVDGITATVDTETVYCPTITWSNIVQEALSLDTQVAAIQADIGDPSARTNLQTLVALLGNPDVAGKTIYADVGDFVGQTNLQSLLAALGIPDVAAKSLYTCLVTDRLDNATFGLSAIETLVDDVEIELAKVPKSDAAVTWNATALASVNAEVDTALNTIVPAAPTAGSLNDALSKASGGNTFNKATDSLEAIGEDTDSLLTAVAAVNTDLGDYSAQTSLQSLLAALGIPDVAAKSLYTCLITDRLDNGTYGLSALETLVDGVEGDLTLALADIGDASASTLGSLLAIVGNPAANSITATIEDIHNTDLPAVATLVAATVAGRLQIVSTTESLNQVAASYPLFTGTTQAVILEKVNLKMPTGAAGGAITSITIQTDDATPGVVFNSTTGAVANLTSEADMSWTGALLINVGTILTLTINGGAHGSAYVATVVAQYRSIVSGGTLVA